MKKGFALQELLISLLLVALLAALVLRILLNFRYDHSRASEMEAVFNLAEEGKWDSCVTTSQDLVLKRVTRGKYSVELLE